MACELAPVGKPVTESQLRKVVASLVRYGRLSGGAS